MFKGYTYIINIRFPPPKVRYGDGNDRVKGETPLPPVRKGEIMKKKLLPLLLVLVLAISLAAVFTACNPDGDTTPEEKIVRVSTTTSVNDSGLMEYLRPYFEKDTGYKWEIASAGTGAAIKAAKYGNADVILVHSKSSEEEFVASGFARKVEGFENERVSFMHNYFVLVGPNDAPDTITDAASVKAAFNEIYTNNYKFISRGDDSGTHKAEIKLWPQTMADLWEGDKITTNPEDIPASIAYNEDDNPNGFYVAAGQGMGGCLTMANEMRGYVLTDKATFLSFKNDKDGDKLPNLKIVYEEDKDLMNVYSMLAVKADAPFVSSIDGSPLPEGTVKIDTAAADVFVKWMTGEHAKALINFYGTTQYGESLFTLGDGTNA